MGLGWWTRSNAEICLLAVKGKPKRKSASVRQLIFAPVEQHSKKPDVVRDRIVELMGDLPRIELFARQTAPGWDVWGNEVNSSISFPYRKAGYSKKFREEHEEEILLHQAAKNAFDDMGVKKLPKVKELQAEYARLLEEKKKTYAEYRRSREKMRELLAAKANVDRLMEMDEERQEDKGKEMNR